MTTPKPVHDVCRPALDARSLTLLPRQPLNVSSTEEAFVVSVTGFGVQRFPVSRVARIHCNALVQWSGAALQLCLQRGITVTWFNTHGQALGCLWPQLARDTTLAELFDTLSSDSHCWPERYVHWLRKQRQLILGDWMQERAAAGSPVSEREHMLASRAWVYKAEVNPHLPEAFQGLLVALVCQHLSEEGLASRYWFCDGREVQLAADLAWLMWGRLNLTGGGILDALHEGKALTQVFETWGFQGRRQLANLLGSLKACAARQHHMDHAP